MRIILLHAYRQSMLPIEAAFRDLWPEAEALSILDESLYSDVAPDGTPEDNVPDRLRHLFQHCVLSGARGVLFTGSTFGPAVEAARHVIDIPVLKADEAMCEAAARRGGRVLLACTAQRAVGVIRSNLAAALAPGSKIETLWIEGAKEANDAGDAARHDRMIAEAVERNAAAFDTIVLGQISMTSAVQLLGPDARMRTLSSPSAAVEKLRLLLEPTSR